jgi:hypothetical protein
MAADDPLEKRIADAHADRLVVGIGRGGMVGESGMQAAGFLEAGDAGRGERSAILTSGNR